MGDSDDLDPRLIVRVDLPGGHWVDMRRDAPAHGIGDEAQQLSSAYPKEDGHGDFVRLELELVNEAVRRGAAAALTGDRLTAWMHARLLAEVAIRLAWICTDAADAAAVIVRIHRLEKRDYKLLLESEDALRRSGAELIVNPAVIKRRAKRFDYPPAPQGLEVMARNAVLPALYGLHRWSSIIVHPGFGSRQHFKVLAPGEPLRAVLAAASSAVVHGGLALRLLYPDVEAPKLVLSHHVALNKGELKLPKRRRPRQGVKSRTSKARR